MIKIYQCKICQQNCCGIPHDGDLYTKEVCCHNHLEMLLEPAKMTTDNEFHQAKTEVEQENPCPLHDESEATWKASKCWQGWVIECPVCGETIIEIDGAGVLC